jgi:hypothetical protein
MCPYVNVKTCGYAVGFVLFVVLCAEDIKSPLIPLGCDIVFLLNMLVTLALSRSSERLWVGLSFPLDLAISEGSIASGSSAYGPARMFEWPESSLGLAEGRSDVFVGFRRRGVIVLVDC